MSSSKATSAPATAVLGSCAVPPALHAAQLPWIPEELRARQGLSAGSIHTAPGNIRGSQGRSPAYQHHSLTHSPTHSLTHSLTHSITQSLTPALAHAPIHSRLLAPGQETAGSYAAGGLGGFVYLRMLQRSVDSFGGAPSSPAAMVGSMTSNNRLLVPFALCLAFNRCCPQCPKP